MSLELLLLSSTHFRHQQQRDHFDLFVVLQLHYNTMALTSFLELSSSVTLALYLTGSGSQLSGSSSLSNLALFVWLYLQPLVTLPLLKPLALKLSSFLALGSHELLGLLDLQMTPCF